MIFQGTGSPDRSQFLTEFWQRKPCLFRQAFPDFVPLLDENDIAGLSCDELVEARLVFGSYPEHDWRVEYGPFREEDLRKLPDSRWTLLVQDVEKHYPPLAALMSQFEFLPSWRLDDLMVSVAGPGGSVGPHYDQYDVFLLQASGRRNWQIAEDFDHSWLPGCDLKVLASFTPETEWILEPGDMLYLPPGVAHHGLAMETGMTWSIGLRAPSQADLLLALGEWLAERENEGERYRDGLPGERPGPGEISAQAIDRLDDLLCKACAPTGKLHSFYASFLTRYRQAHQPAPPERSLEPAAIAARLAGSARLQRNPWTRMAWIRRNGGALLYASGDEYACSIEAAELLCSNALQNAARGDLDPAMLQLVCRLVNDGHLFLSDHC